MIAFLIARGQLKAGQDLGDLPADYAKRVLAEPARFLAVVRDWVSDQDQIPGIAGSEAEEAAAE